MFLLYNYGKIVGYLLQVASDKWYKKLLNQSNLLFIKYANNHPT